MNIGDRIGDYEIVQIIGAGGMGQVYKVRNTLSERIEAMKVALPNLEGSQELVERFVREIKVQAALDHPHIAKLHTAMRYGNQLLMFMEFVDGNSLSKMVEGGPLPIASVMNYAIQALDALGYAHAQGVVHRDIKPANIMVTTNGVVKLMDFGIARAKTDRKLTQTGSAVGSLFYMSPEQIRGGEPDPRSDLYSFGITLYELVTGKRPFGGDSDFQIMSAHLQDTPAPPVALVPGIPSEFSEIVLMAIAKDPEARFQSAQAFRGALASVGVAGGTAVLPPQRQTTPASQQATAPHVTRPQAPPAHGAPPPLPAAQLPVQPPAQPAASRRGLYMALGSVATLAVLIGAVIEGPKLFNGGSSGAQTQPASLPNPQSVTQPAAAPSIPSQPAAPQSAQTPQGLPAAASPAAAPPVASPVPQPIRTPAPQVPSRAAATPQQAAPITQPPQAAPRPVISQVPVAQPVAAQPAAQPAPQQQAAPLPPPPQPAAQVPTAAPAQQAPPRPPPPSPELNELRERYNFVSIRANTAKGGLAPLEQQLTRQGFGLRADIREARSRVDYLLQESMTSIRAGDVEGGKRNLQGAERALESIERFLGR